MLEVHAIIHNKKFYSCSCCALDIDFDEAIENEWKVCPRCAQNLWSDKYYGGNNRYDNLYY